MENKLTGMYAALLSGFADNGDLDRHRQINITQCVAHQGLHGLYVGGSSGESGLMSTEELLEQQAIVHEATKGTSQRLIAHVGQPNLRDSVQLAKNAERLGYDGLSALPPHSYAFSQSEIKHYYENLAKSTALPLIVYEAPSRTGRDSSFEELSSLLSINNVVGIKFTSQDLYKFSRLRSQFPDHLLFFGFDEIYAVGAFLGSDGGIGTTYNLMGKLYVELDHAVKKSDLPRARHLQSLSRQLVEILVKTGVLAGTKLALQQCGVDCGDCREPFQCQSDSAATQLQELVTSSEYREWLPEE